MKAELRNEIKDIIDGWDRETAKVMIIAFVEKHFVSKMHLKELVTIEEEQSNGD